ncbi:MAG: methionyl-tRNA formyltransferase [Acidobacteriota bacterium]|nr:methionyl-tRNA formyltransferase [Acidobacteriota bacterium]
MKIVFFGSPAIALPALNSLIQVGHEIKLVITQPDRPAGRGKKLTSPPVKVFAQNHGLPCLQSEKIKRDDKVLEAIKQAGPDVNVVVAYGQIIPASIIYFPPLKTLNIHFSLLPRYRGAAPVEWAILSGETTTGVTIIELNEKMDEGPILAQKEVGILPGENAHELEIRLSYLGAELLIDTLARINEIRRIDQDHEQASYAPKLTKDQGKIDWQESAGAIDLKVRAFFPWPGAYSFFHGQKVEILSGQAIPGTFSASSPGEILHVDKSGLYISCGQNTTYLIEKIKPQSKKEMSAYAFSLSGKIKSGTKLG